MKTILIKLSDGIILGIGFFLIVGMVQARTGLQVSESDTLLSSKWNELVGKVETNEGLLQGLSNNSGNIGIANTSPSEKLDVGGTVKANVFDIGYEMVSDSKYLAEWYSDSISVTCPLGKKVISGGCHGSRVNSENNSISRNYPVDNGWYCHSQSSTAYDLTLTVYAICANVK